MSERDFEALVRRHERALRRYAEGILRDRLRAEEVVQDAFLKAHRLLERGDVDFALRPWLFRVVRNGALDALRAEAARPTVPLAHELGQTQIMHADPAQQVIESEELRAVLRDIAGLPERQRDVLLAREVDGTSHRQIARELGLTEIAVRGLSSRARENLVAGVVARDARCDDVREQMRHSRRLRRRATGDVHRHLRECAGCREYRERLGRVQVALQALSPGPLVGFVAFAGGGTGMAVKTAATATVATVALAGGTLVFGAGDPQPYEVPAAGVLTEPLDRGARVPRGAAVVRRYVRSTPERVVRATVPCPDGMRVAGAAPQPADATSWGLDPQITVGFDRAAVVRISRGPARKIAVVVLCKRPRSDGSILAGTPAFAAAKATIRKVCARRAYLFESPNTATIGSVYRGQPLRIRRYARKRTWAAVRTDAGVLGWVRASALCK